MIIFDKVYDGESIYDVGRDVAEAFCEDFNTITKQIPKNECGFQQGTFRVSVVWTAEGE